MSGFRESDGARQPQGPLGPSRGSVPGERTAAETRAMVLIGLMMDGNLSPPECDELRAIFQACPALLQSYVEQAVAHATLEWRHVQVAERGRGGPDG